MISYVDTHIHLDLLATPGPLLEEARSSGTGAWVVPGLSGEQWPGMMAVTERYAGVYAAPGVHPQSSDRFQKSDFETLHQLLQHPGVVALGEVGLDRHVDIPWQVQEEVFIRMIRLAHEMDKPLLIHSRRTTDRILELLQRQEADRLGGIFHAFSGSLESARKIIDMGFALGIGGVVTFPTARRLPEVVRMVPAEMLVLETDAPNMTPAPHRGDLNRPAYLALIAERVAVLRGWSLEETARITTANALRILKLSLPDENGIKGKGHEQP